MAEAQKSTKKRLNHLSFASLICVHWITQMGKHCTVVLPTTTAFGVNYMWTADISLEAGVRVSRTKVIESTLGLQSAKQTPSSCLSFDLLLAVVNPPLGWTTQPSQISHAISLCNLALLCHTSVPSSQISSIFPFWHSNTAPFHAPNTNSHGNRTENHTVHHANKSRMQPW